MPPSHAESTRSTVQKLLHATPFRPFALVLDGGQQVLVEHPENFAFDVSGKRRARDFSLISGDQWVFSTFERVTSVALLDEQGLAG